MMEPHDHDSRPVGVLVRDAAGQLSQLAHQEMELARLEVRDDFVAATTGIAGVGIAGGAAALCVLFAALAAMFGLAVWLPMWAAALIVAGVFLVAAGLFAIVGRRAMTHVRRPERTVQTLKEDVECLRHPNS